MIRTSTGPKTNSTEIQYNKQLNFFQMYKICNLIHERKYNTQHNTNHKV